ncbi:hypothetical protein MSAN_01098600 [Mycena sanguinolenta]|uniref:Uncharacterized protein n=1 Tax=Mycena sanguinolenta TaxID=230812 RepID=A0A8H6YSI9_9AGAR|nr:hypothetical protein MSAN_01098600 [Mycena sanguinolenta]
MSGLAPPPDKSEGGNIENTGAGNAVSSSASRTTQSAVQSSSAISTTGNLNPGNSNTNTATLTASQPNQASQNFQFTITHTDFITYSVLAAAETKTAFETDFKTNSVLAAAETNVGPATFSQASSSTPEHKVLSSGAIASIALAGIAFVCASTALFRRIRRRRRRMKFSGDVEINRGGRTISPFTLLVEARSFGTGDATGSKFNADAAFGMRSISASTIARQRLETQLRAATERMAELEEMAEGGTTAGDPNTVLAGAGRSEVASSSVGGVPGGPPPDWGGAIARGSRTD